MRGAEIWLILWLMKKIISNVKIQVCKTNSDCFDDNTNDNTIFYNQKEIEQRTR